MTFVITNCENSKSMKEMKWLGKETEYEGYPLYLRCPDYDNVWLYKQKFTKLLCLSQQLEKVKNNGLPESDYNLSLADFDYSMTNLFETNNEGIIILVETFGGERNYWYYISENLDYKSKLAEVQKKYPMHKLETIEKDDMEWGFITKYPVKLFEKK